MAVKTVPAELQADEALLLLENVLRVAHVLGLVIPVEARELAVPLVDTALIGEGDVRALKSIVHVHGPDHEATLLNGETIEYRIEETGVGPLVATLQGLSHALAPARVALIKLGKNPVLIGKDEALHLR